MALGAHTKEVLVMMLRQSALLTLIGISFGVIAGLGLKRFLASLLYGITATDAVTLVLAIAIMIFVALAAAYIPAHRASRVDPMAALRFE